MFWPLNMFSAKTMFPSKTMFHQNYVFTKNSVFTKNHVFPNIPVFTQNHVFTQNKKLCFHKKNILSPKSAGSFGNDSWLSSFEFSLSLKKPWAAKSWNLHYRFHGASGIGASICFKLNSFWIASSSILGIMFGGLMNGIEKDGRIASVNEPLAFCFEKFIFTGSNCSHRRPLMSKGSMTTVPLLFF